MQRSSRSHGKKKIREIVDDSRTSLICMNKRRNDKRCYVTHVLSHFKQKKNGKRVQSYTQPLLHEEKQQDKARKGKGERTTRRFLAVVIIGSSVVTQSN